MRGVYWYCCPEAFVFSLHAPSKLPFRGRFVLLLLLLLPPRITTGCFARTFITLQAVAAIVAPLPPPPPAPPPSTIALEEERGGVSGCFKRRGVPFFFLEAVARPKPLVTFQDRISRTWCCRRGRKHAGFFLGRCCTVKVSACMHLMCVNAERSLNFWLPPYAVDVGGLEGFQRGSVCLEKNGGGGDCCF